MYSGFQVTGMIEGFFGFEVFDSGIFFGLLEALGIFWILTFSSIRSFPSLEIPSPHPGN